MGWRLLPRWMILSWSCRTRLSDQFSWWYQAAERAIHSAAWVGRASSEFLHRFFWASARCYWFWAARSGTTGLVSWSRGGSIGGLSWWAPRVAARTHRPHARSTCFRPSGVSAGCWWTSVLDVSSLPAGKLSSNTPSEAPRNLCSFWWTTVSTCGCSSGCLHWCCPGWAES